MPVSKIMEGKLGHRVKNVERGIYIVPAMNTNKNSESENYVREPCGSE